MSIPTSTSGPSLFHDMLMIYSHNGETVQIEQIDAKVVIGVIQDVFDDYFTIHLSAGGYNVCIRIDAVVSAQKIGP